MKSLLLLAAMLPLAAQTSPVAATDNWLSGSVDLGYRWRSSIGGSVETWRSIVDLGSGPKLLNADFTILDPRHRLFDRVDVRAADWGDDPSSTLHIDARKGSLYRFNADYRSLAFYDNLPSFADPQLARGVFLDEQAFDTRRRMGSYDLELFPGKRFVPYFSYQRDSNTGRGISTFANGSANEYAVPNTSRDFTNLYRAGVRIGVSRLHATLEAGGTTYHESQNTYVAPGGKNPGDITSTLFGQSLYLSTLLQAYGVSGSSTYAKAYLSAAAFSWLDVSGQFVFSQPRNDLNYQQFDTGNLVALSQALVYSSEQYLARSTAKLPHTTGGFSAEARPFSRLRILESWLTDREHSASSTSGTGTFPALLSSFLAVNYNQQETNILLEVTRRLTLRGGYRYVWGDASNLISPSAGLFTAERGSLHRNVALAGVVFRTGKKLSLHGDLEASSATGAYFRTSLYNYDKVRAQATYQLLPTLNLTAGLTYLINRNPTAGAHYDFQVGQESLSLAWLPAGGKRWNVQTTYERSAVHSDITYLVPQTLTPAASVYRENAHSVTALLTANLPSELWLHPQFSAGGSAFISSGTRPTTYYQPLARISLPLSHGVTWFGEWRYYGFGETFFLYESFRTHLLTTGLRFTR